ncbi:RIO kinase 1 [Terracoccus luteus]|uniref:non-specific serine/threonine protein kinase n=1 Tax=Terracoccus luteus TaxID=53356 RepID=A0A495Y0E9_9MICO|nr:RIO1 family regulatory kinase/ATPase [Terracoccus luteus]RKT78614.1 RIO kinase 1 [Terracoccus luteus]
MSHNAFDGQALGRSVHDHYLDDVPASASRRGRRFPAHRDGDDPAFAVDSEPDRPPAGDRWSSWDGATHGPTPRPDWVVTDLGAVDEDLGVLKTGKEADVHIVRRWVPAPDDHEAPGGPDPSHGSPHDDRSVLLAAKRYRPATNRLFHRDAGYLEGRRVRKSRETRAMATRTAFGKQVISGLWAFAEFETLSTLWKEGLPVPYPVQMDGREMLMELVGADGQAAPRLAQCRPDRGVLPDLFEQLREAMLRLAELGWAHGDLSPYNVLLDDAGGTPRLVLIDWPQIVDAIGNPHGPEFLERDARAMCEWFTRRGFEVDHGVLFGDLMAAATSRW